MKYWFLSLLCAMRAYLTGALHRYQPSYTVWWRKTRSGDYMKVVTYECIDCKSKVTLRAKDHPLFDRWANPSWASRWWPRRHPKAKETAS